MTQYKFHVTFEDGSVWEEIITSKEELNKKLDFVDTKKFEAWWSLDDLSITEFKKGFAKWLEDKNPGQKMLVKWKKVA